MRPKRRKSIQSFYRQFQRDSLRNCNPRFLATTKDFKYPEVLVELSDALLSFSTKFDEGALRAVWHSAGMENSNSHDLIGKQLQMLLNICV